MATKNYLKEFIKEGGYYYAWPGGWECRFSENQITFPRGTPSAGKADVREQIRIHKLIARVSENRAEFRKLIARCDEFILGKIKELDLKGYEMRNYILTTPTNQEVRNQAIRDYGFSFA